jgi:hypothetical protein
MVLAPPTADVFPLSAEHNGVRVVNSRIPPFHVGPRTSRGGPKARHIDALSCDAGRKFTVVDALI